MGTPSNLALNSIVVMCLLMACFFGSASAADSVLISDVPHVLQKPDYCGEACVASWLQKLGKDITQDHVFNASGLEPTLGRGCYTKELHQAMERLGFDPGPVWQRVAVADQEQQIQQAWESIRNDLGANIPSIICMRTSDGPGATEHFRLILGYDATSDEVIYHEPAEPNGAYHRMSRSKLLHLWPLKYDTRQWTLIRLALKQIASPQVPTSTGFSNSDYAQHIMRLKSRLPSEDFTILIEPPFVVIGDESPAVVKQRAEQTIRWATTRLKKQYFAKDPNEILDIWLFKDKFSYEANTVRLFGDKPSTPYGYYSSSDGALVMNIATGGGTLVHEIVHPFIESNFPDCPAWFNEGLGSLYEQSSTREGKIVGLTNWRLAGLQRAIKSNSVPSFATTCSTTTNQFYRQDPGTNYSQSRYLCYYMQEKGLLNKYYHAFVANSQTDPTGYKTLQQVLGVEDMKQFQQDWQQYVLSLRFP